MYKRRLIPVLFLKDGWMVRSQNFDFHQYIGDPVHHVRRMVQWDVDELIVLDIGETEMSFDHHRSDYRNKPVSSTLEFINLIAAECNIPLTFGGRIQDLDGIAVRIRNGADKVSVNRMLHTSPATVTEAAKQFGSQAITASIDYRMIEDVSQVFVDHSREAVNATAKEWAERAESLGAGEILLNAIDRDGKARGYDIETINQVADAVQIPVIACGGAGIQNHFGAGFEKSRANALAAGNIFHFTENAYPNAKRYLRTKFEDIRLKI